VNRTTVRRICLGVALGLASAPVTGFLSTTPLGGSGPSRAGSAHAATFSPMFGFNWSFAVPPTAAQEAAINPNAVQRVVVNWAQLQPSCWTLTGPGVCQGGPKPVDWTSLDSAISALQAKGIRVLLLVLNAPPWAWSLSDCGLVNGASTCTLDPTRNSIPPGDNPKDLGYLSTFLTELMQHSHAAYSSSEVVGTEIWNEENSWYFWKTAAGPSAARFTRMMCAAYPAIHSANASLPIVMGGLADASTSKSWGNTVIQTATGTFLGSTYGDGLKGCMTYIGAHAYVRTQADTTQAEGITWVVHQVQTIETLNNDSGRPIWITETGYCTNSGNPQCGTSSVSQTDQANGEECAYQLMAGIPQVQAVFIQTLYDTGPGDVGTTTLGFGVYTEQNTPKQAQTMWTRLFGTYGQSVPGISTCSNEYNWSGRGYSW
jgi:cellulase (glycosyl hydrolase family 5)